MISYCGLLVAITLILVVCLLDSIRSKRATAGNASWLLGLVAFNSILNAAACIINTSAINQVIYSLTGFVEPFIFFSILMLIRQFCNYDWGGKKLKSAIFVLCAFDGIMMIANIFTHWTFKVIPQYLDERMIYNAFDYSWYNNVHSTVVGCLVLSSYLVLISKIVRSSKVVVQDYIFITICLFITSFWSAYVRINSFYDDSVIGVGIFSVIIFYYAVEFKPVALLDRMKSTIVSTVRDGILFFDENGRCIYANNSAKFLLDVKTEQDMENAREKIYSIINQTPESMASVKSESFKANYSDGNIDYNFEIEYHKLYDGKGMFIGSFVSIDDRTEEIKKLEREHYLAAHDQLTGLYNSRHFFECVDEKVKSLENSTDYVMLTADVKGFKLINDRYGHEVGDEILKKIAQVIEANCTSSTRTLYARLTADKFAVFTHKELASKERLDKILSDFDKSFGSEYSIVIHIGVYGLEAEDLEASIMYDRALIAISSIKNSLDTRVAYYNSRMRENLLWEQKINATLDDAIREGSIVPYLQAQVDGAGNVVGAEVLVRWISTEEGIIPPYKFIPILEKNGTIAKVDLYMWECACKILRKWAEEGKDNLYLSVNISPRDFYALDVVNELKKLVLKYQINPARLRLEITETVMMDDANSKISVIQDLRDAGFVLEMDDFGSGYSSLNMLKDMPVDIIKLDMMFMSKTDNKERTDIIVNLIVKLAYDLGLSVIAEGVETKEQYDNLMGIGCRSFQGYYFAKPIPVMEFESKVS